MASALAGLLDVDNGVLRYEVAGHGPAIVLIHAFSFDMRQWDLQVPDLAKSHRVVRYDLRGFGQSSPPESAYDHCEDLARLFDHLKIERPLLVGVSLGSNVALNFASRFPDRISGMVLSSPGLAGHVWKEKRPPEAASEFAQKHGVEEGKKNWLAAPIFSSLFDFPDALARTNKILEDYSGWHWMHTDMQVAAKPVIDILEDIQVPALILSGKRDVSGYREIASILSQRLANADLYTFENAGHMHSMEMPEAFNDRIIEFASSLKAKGRNM